MCRQDKWQDIWSFSPFVNKLLWKMKLLFHNQIRHLERFLTFLAFEFDKIWFRLYPLFITSLTVSILRILHYLQNRFIHPIRLQRGCNLEGRCGHHNVSPGGADAERSLTGASPWGGFNFMVLKKLVTWPGTSAKTLWASISWGAWGEETQIIWWWVRHKYKINEHSWVYLTEQQIQNEWCCNTNSSNTIFLHAVSLTATDPLQKEPYIFLDCNRYMAAAGFKPMICWMYHFNSAWGGR